VPLSSQGGLDLDIFVNGVALKDAVSFEEVEQKIKSLLKQ
jgi:hypothetical protein